ncbi:TetR/AcrR family transcriptional regulator C-terminal domain-containing protein [Nocardia transvalensis]|uniref:TetR/AcrR family transcriptional regulator C-terminal domain-containing protein n=1 Tax=Nocardia transvalensis TaxID=37333 RepID=UPI0018944592|nr:TetR/AcrR family transcriptional regulator C-terminal domain-containing protein [Nocardia transvalensis]MBF6328611.1 TetR/AcrR family transcriptional regulator C-terminal domain-containing protein [Nocardia transvalensis]
MRAQPLSRDAIVAAARRIADAEGLAALTLRRVAQELDTGQASLYRHIADRRELLALLNDDLARSFPVAHNGSARERLIRQWCAAHRILLEHPWAARVVIDAASVTPTALPFTESAMSALLEAGLDAATAARTYRAAWHLLIGQVVNEHPLGHPGFEIDPAAYPALTAARPHLLAADPAAEFEWSLRRLLDGVLGPCEKR